MKIKLWADLVSWPLEASVSGDVITINGEAIDLSGIPDGYRLPGSAVGNKFFVESEFVERKGKTLHFTLRLPVSWDSPEEYRNPAGPIILDARSGPVKFPDTTPIKPTTAEVIEPGEQLEVAQDGGSIEA
ncbi:hypothetical protein [Pseudomonas fluorescens]|uniref:hypothetical protein n=1 Tax=Pseudomonas fluorescens TaxID=294 RepID=UPI0003641094|nr:hypothetical protein [Pseudomonas fluorescens]